VLGVSEQPQSAESHRIDRPRRVTLRAFHIARDLVSVREFAEFLATDNFYQWDDAQILVQRSFTYNSLVKSGDKWVYQAEDGGRPVDQATWIGAMLYCVWLTERDPAGRHFSLPSEWEWEYAARGVQGCAWPWGNEDPAGERGWIWGSKKLVEQRQQKLPYLGSYPMGSTPEGVRDLMSYGCLEWCADAYHDDPGDIEGVSLVDIDVDWTRPRVARGGYVREKSSLSFREAVLSETSAMGRVWSRWSCDPILEVSKRPFVFRTVLRDLR
jgi:formylglycine-generating enzyme required for sulfatase activity